MAQTTTTATTRRFGVAVLGLFAGALVGFGLHEALARSLLALTDGALPASVGLGLALAYLTPVLAVLGLVTALRMDTKRRRHSRSTR